MFGHYVMCHPQQTSKYAEYYRHARMIEHPFYCEESEKEKYSNLTPNEEEIEEKELMIKIKWDEKDNEAIENIKKEAEEQENEAKNKIPEKVPEKQQSEEEKKQEDNNTDFSDVETKSNEMIQYFTDFEKKFDDMMKRHE